MATEEYQIDYKATDGATAITNALAAAMKALDAAVIQAKKDLSGFAAGASSSAAAAATNIAALNASLNGTASAAQPAMASVAKLGTATESTSASFAKMRMAMMAIREVESVLNAIGEGLRKAGEYTDQLAEKNLKLRDTMRELANLQGHDGPDDQVTGEALLLGMAAGMKPAESVKFLEQFEGSIPAGRQKGNIGAAGATEEQKKQLEHEMAKEGAAFGSRIGLEASTAGDLTGVIPMYRKIESVKDLAGEQGALAYGLNEGRGKITTLMRSELGASGNMIGSGHVKDLAELGAFVGVASTTAKTASSAGTAVKQLDQLLYTGKDQPGGDYLESIGVNKHQYAEDRLHVLRDDLKKNGGTDPNSYLASKGFASREQRSVAVAMTGNFGLIEQRAAKAREMAKDGTPTLEANRNFLDSTITGQNRKAEAAQAAAEFLQGKDKESLLVARKFAESRLRAKDGIDTEKTNATDALNDSFGKLTFGLARPARERRIDVEVLRNLNEEADRLGIPAQARVPSRESTFEHEGKVNKFNTLAPLVSAKGGNPLGDSGAVASDIKELVELQKEANRMAKDNGGRPPVAPRGGVPDVVPKR